MTTRSTVQRQVGTAAVLAMTSLLLAGCAETITGTAAGATVGISPLSAETSRAATGFPGGCRLTSSEPVRGGKGLLAGRQ